MVLRAGLLRAPSCLSGVSRALAFARSARNTAVEGPLFDFATGDTFASGSFRMGTPMAALMLGYLFAISALHTGRRVWSAGACSRRLPHGLARRALAFANMLRLSSRAPFSLQGRRRGNRDCVRAQNQHLIT